MENAYVVKGKLDESGVLTVLDRVPLPPGEVEVIIKPVPAAASAKHSVWEVVESSPFERPADEILARLKALRNEWDR